MRIRWTDSAIRDFTHICDYIEKDRGPAIARRVALSIHRQIDLLAEFPEYGRTGRKSDTRELSLEWAALCNCLPYPKRFCGDCADSTRSAGMAEVDCGWTRLWHSCTGRFLSVGFVRLWIQPRSEEFSK